MNGGIETLIPLLAFLAGGATVYFITRAGQKERARQQKLEFQNLANKILEQSSNTFSQRSEKSLNDLLAPMRERFGEFQNLISKSFGEQHNQHKSLKEEIARIVMQADSLTRALKGDVKAQGNWGEVVLERILEDAGLKKGETYIVQGEGMGLRHPDDGSVLKPDVVVLLPENKHIIIDSKVSLTHYERYCGETDEAARAVLLKQFIASVKAHVSGLAARRYQDTEKLGTPDFVLLFMPIESAYSLAVQEERELHGYAWNQRIVLVCPSTLFATLRTINSLWRIEQQNRNVQKIAESGGRLYDKIAGFVDDMEKLGKQLGTAERTYDEAMKKLATGNGNMLRQAEQLKALGAKTSKSLPKTLLTVDEGRTEVALELEGQE